MEQRSSAQTPQPLNAADFIELERAAISYLWSVVRGTERYDDGRYRSAMVILGYLDKHHAPTQAPPEKRATETPTDPESFYEAEKQEGE